MEDIKIVYIEAALMPNGEVLSWGKSLGHVSNRQMELVKSGACKMTRGSEPIIALGKNNKPA